MAELLMMTTSISFALPLSVALFKQQAVINRDKLEEEFQNIKEGEEVVETFYFNKGL